jgi:uncharacterized protein GlcG (DUF336 family)
MKQIYLAAVFTVSTITLFAQSDLEKFTISAEAAKKTLIKDEINVDTAQKIAQACVDFAKSKNQAVTVNILSPTGSIVYSYRMDGQVPINVETSMLKAQSVLYTRDSSHARLNQVSGNLSLQMRWAPLGVFPVPGGLPIIVEGRMIGVIGVGGANMDEECAYQAVTKVVGAQPPLAPTLPAPPKPAPAK